MKDARGRSTELSGGPAGKVRIRGNGRIAGYVYDHSNPGARFAVEVWAGDKLVTTKNATGRTPNFSSDAPDDCGFGFFPRDFKVDWVDQPIVFRIVGTDRTVGRGPLLLRRSIKFERLVFAARQFTALVSAPPGLGKSADLAATVDGVEVALSRSINPSGDVLLRMRRPNGGGSGEHLLELRWAKDGEPVENAPVSFRWPEPSLNANPDFSRWSGDHPVGWEVAEGGWPWRHGSASVERFGEGGALSTIVFDAEESSASRTLLSQPLPAMADGFELEVRLLARAVKADATVTIEGGAYRSEQRVALAPDWQEHVLRFPATALSTGGRLTLGLATQAAGPIEIGVVIAGPPGCYVAGQEADEASSGPVVRNGDFASWPGGLAFDASERRTELAAGWAAVTRAADPKLRVALTEVDAPDKAGGTQRVYGMAVTGEGPVRLEAELDKAALASAPLDRLTLVLGTRSGRLAPSRIARILVLARQAATEDRPAVEEVVAQLTGAVGIPSRPSRLSWGITGMKQGAIAIAAESALLKEDVTFVLAIELSAQMLDLVLAEVAMGEGRQAHLPREIGYLAVEDRAIARQLDRLKGFEAWRSAEVLSPIRAAQADGATAAPSWHWHGTATVDIVVPVHNAIDDVMNCLRAVERATPLPHRVVIVDDASGLPTRSELERYVAGRPWVELVRNEHNLGYTRTANMGLTRSTSEWVVLLNSDTIVSRGWLGGLLDCAATDPAIAAVGPLSNAASWQSVPELRDVRGRWMVNPLAAGLDVDGMAELVERLSERAFPCVPLLNGFCTLFRRSALEASGFLDEKTFPVGYGEENDLCLRLGEAGYKLVIADQVYVYHVKSASFGDARRTELARAGAIACSAKHPKADLQQAEIQLAECLPLIRLRQALRAAAAFPQPAEPEAIAAQ